MGLLFVSQEIYEHGESWWNYVDEKTPDSTTKALSGKSHQQRHLVTNQEVAKRNDGFCLQNISLICNEIVHGADRFNSPVKEGVLLIFNALKNQLLQPGFNPQTYVQWQAC
jgi:hypothetical protein